MDPFQTIFHEIHRFNWKSCWHLGHVHDTFTTNTIDSRWNWERYTIIKLTNMGETYFQESDLRIWVKNMFRNLVLALGPSNCSYWGASSPPDPLAGGWQPLCPPAYR